jgi:trehalose 6-phosphate synthase
MNLVAKEYVAAQNPEDPGVLILSRFAGAAEELGDALIVNPYNIGAVADMIRVALEMDLPERRARHRALMSVVEKHNSAAWSQSFLDTLERSSQSREVANWPSSENIRTALDALRLSANPAKPEKTRRTPRKSRTMGSDQAVSTVSETKQ